MSESEGNKICAEFMGAIKQSGSHGDELIDKIFGRPKHLLVPDLGYFDFIELKYNTDYNWFMPVWQRFKDLKFENSFYENRHYELLDRIEKIICRKPLSEAFAELVEGIKWINGLNRSDE